MPFPLKVKIAGIGRFVPENVVTAEEIESRCNAANCKLEKGWVVRHTGVSERRRVMPGQTNSTIGAIAAREAIADAGLQLSDIDLIINASGTPERAIPDGAPLLQRELGLASSGIPCFTIHATCLSFVVALDVCANLLVTGRYRSILIVSSEISGPGINYKEPESASLFGDMAAAVVLVPTPKGESSAIRIARLETFSEGLEYCTIRGGGSYRSPNSDETIFEDNCFSMDGPRVFRLAHKVVPPFFEKLRPGLSDGLGEIDYVIPHQASLLAVKSLQKKLNIPDDKIMINLEKYGNCVAASIPAALYDAIKQEKIVRGNEVLLVGTGAGLSVGGAIFCY